jgi:hypothetical protein
MQTLANFKRGDIFQLGGIAKDSGGITIDLTAVTLRSQVRTGGGALEAELLVNTAAQVTNKGEFSLSFATTTDWPTGEMLPQGPALVAGLLIALLVGFLFWPGAAQTPAFMHKISALLEVAQG